MVINVRAKKNSGRTRYYADNQISRTLLDIFKKKSFTVYQLRALKSVGFRINVTEEDMTRGQI